MAIFRWRPPNWGSNAGGIGTIPDSQGISGYWSMTAGRSANNNCARPSCSLTHRLPCISESLFITTSIDHNLLTYLLTTTTKKREQYLFVCSGESEANVINNRLNCIQLIVLLKLTTDRHKASHGFSAIAELLVSYNVNRCNGHS